MANDGFCSEDTAIPYRCIVVGGGAAGLFFAAGESLANGRGTGGRKVILEKSPRPGRKILMSGGGSCNITHGGQIRDFIGKYGDNGKLIRTCLYRHSNAELMKTMKSLGVRLTEQADGRVFPASMKASDVLDSLLSAAGNGGWEIRTGSEVTGIKVMRSDEVQAEDSGCNTESSLIRISLADGTWLTAEKLVIATGGASYPLTGSDGSFFTILKRDLGVTVVDPRPALAPVYVQDFDYGDLAGISFSDITVSCEGHVSCGPALITHRGFSGPAILHISQYARPGDELVIDFCPGVTGEALLVEARKDQPGSAAGLGNWLAVQTGLPRAFVHKVADGPGRKLSAVSITEIRSMISRLTSHSYSVSGTGGWNDAMVTAGGVSLEQIDLRTMRLRSPGSSDIRIIGEALDVNGESGGYNLQFAYSSAMTALGK